MFYMHPTRALRHRVARAEPAGSPHTDVQVRLATPEDGAALRRLAGLDSGRAPEGSTLVAVADGRMLAALPLDGGRALSDPFSPTADLVTLLELRAAQLRPDRRPRIRRAARVAALAPARRAA